MSREVGNLTNKIWKKIEATKMLSFLVFLLFSESFIIFRLRLMTNDILYNFQQFRYQYISNVFIILGALLILSKVLKLWKKGRAIVYCLLSVVLVLNIYCSIRGCAFVSAQLKPLKKLVQNIKADLGSGKINAEEKLYIDDNIAEMLPVLCWNRYMGSRYMKGTYQWVFNEKEIKYFAFSPEEAKWIVDEKNFNIIRK